MGREGSYAVMAGILFSAVRQFMKIYEETEVL